MAKRSAWGSIKQSRPGVWQLRFPLPSDPATGKRRQGFETVHGSKKDASTRLAELQLQHDRRSLNRSELTVSACWSNHYRPYIDRLAASTVEGYESAYRVSIAPSFGSRSMGAIRKAEVQSWLDTMSYGAARKAFALFRAMFSFAVDNDLVGSSPFDKRYSFPPKPRKSTKENAYSVQTEDKLRERLRAARGELWEAAYILSAFGGLRREEAFGAQWGDIDFAGEYAVVRVSRGVQRAKGGTRVVPLKTNGSYREAIIPAPYSERLHELFYEHISDRWICEADNGEPMNPDLMASAYKRWHFGKQCRYIPWRNLRNSYATMLHAGGTDLGTVAKLLGHSTPTVTFKHYDRMSAEQLAEAVSVLGEKRAPCQSVSKASSTKE